MEGGRELHKDAMRLSTDSNSTTPATDLEIEANDPTDIDEEQTQTLLEKTGVKDVRSGRHVRRSGSRRLVALFALLLLGCTATALFFVGAAHNPGNPSKNSRVSLQRSNDYILNPEWDFQAAPSRREYHWTITDEYANPDGVFRPMILINKQFPGPLIEVNEHDTIVVHVNNQASNATSIHWHGIYQKGSNWMDGTVGVTQCPIAPGTTFTYEFTVSGQSGTYWYHAHHGVQTSDGLLGPLIVHAQEEKSLQKISYASDRVVMVQDYYHDLSTGLLVDYLGPDKENAEPVPDGALINGQNVRNCTALPHRQCNAENAALPVFDIARDGHHRLRFINVGAFAEFQVQIDEHEFAVTEVDGTDVEPSFYHRLNINPGQRYSIIISANNSDAESFWLRARMVTTCFAEPNPDLEPEIRAVVRYGTGKESPAAVSPTSKDWAQIVELECHDMNITEMHPVVAQPPPIKPDTSLYLRSNFEIGAHRLSRGVFNASSFRPNLRSPTLHRVINGLAESDQSFTTDIEHISSLSNSPILAHPFPPVSHGVGINTGAYDPKTELVLQTRGTSSVIDLIFTNFDDGAHPLHLHGYKFWLLGQGAGYPPADIMNLAQATSDADNAMASGIDLSNPLRRDTATVPAYGWIHIRVLLDNPGAWLLHCHVAWHFEAGMGMVLTVGMEEMQKELLSDEAAGEHGWLAATNKGKSMCSMPGVTRGGRVGDDYWDDMR